MMGLEQRREREITYQIGWKRGIIAADKGQSNKHKVKIPWVHRLNIAFLWKNAGTAPIRVMLVLLWIVPVLTFICSLWLVHVLSIE